MKIDETDQYDDKIYTSEFRVEYPSFCVAMVTGHNGTLNVIK